MPLRPGTRLGPYDLVAKVGEGGMGEVYRARDTRLDRTVAIKVLREALGADSQRRGRFDREARALAALNHPHICTLYDVSHHEDIDFLVMEYLEGDTLADRLENGPLTTSEALRFGIEIADALDRAHRAGIIHRDLKPGNIMLTASGGQRLSADVTVKLLDFGLAKSAPAVVGGGLSELATAATNLTADGAILGTIRYMAPEQLEGQEADARTDIFAFGVVLYEMLTGRRAFGGTTQASTIGAILHSDPPRPSSVQSLVPAAIDRIVMKCLAKDPDARWQSARDLADTLRWIAEGAAPATAVAPSPQRRWGRTAALLSVVALLMAAVLVFMGSRRTAELQTLRLDVNTPPTSDPVSFELAPDGRSIVFVATADGRPKLWLRALAESNARVLPGTEGASYPFWAPDGRALGFFADGKLKRLDLASGTLDTLADAPTGRGGAWNQDGVILFSAGLTGLMRVDAKGGIPLEATHRGSGEGNHRWPVFLPDGRHFLFFVSFSRPDVQGVYFGTLDTTETRRLMAADTAAQFVAPNHLLMVRRDVLMAATFDSATGVVSGDPLPVAAAIGSDVNLFRGAFSVSATGLLAYRTGGNGSRQVAALDRSGALISTFGLPDENNLIFTELSPDGRRFAVTRTVQGNSDIWLVDVSRGALTRFTTHTGVDDFPTWSPDGTRLAYRSNRDAVFGLFQRAVDGAAEERAIGGGGQNRLPSDWSPDGQLLLFTAPGEKTGYDLWTQPLTDTRAAMPFVQTPADEDEGQFSPDGRWIAYRSNESGRSEIYLRPFPGPGNQFVVSTTGGDDPRWRRDGKELFYVAVDRKLMAVSVALAADGQAVTLGAPVALFPTRITSVSLAKPQYSVTADGQRFLMNVGAGDDATSPITIVQNWSAGLAQK